MKGERFLGNEYAIGRWIVDKLKYEKLAQHAKTNKVQVNQLEIWECDLGFNIGQEKDKKRPVVVLSKNTLNQGGKVLVAPITGAMGKMSYTNPFHPRFLNWFLLHTSSPNPLHWYDPKRQIPKSATIYNCLTKDSMIHLEAMRSVSKARLTKKLPEVLSQNDWIKVQKILQTRVF